MIKIGELGVSDIVRFGSDNSLCVVVEVLSDTHVRLMTLLGAFYDQELEKVVGYIDRPIDSFASSGAPSGWLTYYKETPNWVMIYDGHQLMELQANWAKIQAKFPEVGDCPFHSETSSDLEYFVDDGWWQGSTPKVRIDVWDPEQLDLPRLVTFINPGENVEETINWLKESWRNTPPTQLIVNR